MKKNGIDHMFYQIKSWKINKSVELMRKIEKNQGKNVLLLMTIC